MQTIIIIICIIMVFVFILSGLPVGFAFATGTLLLIIFLGLNPGFIPVVAWDTLETWPLISIPLFILAGYLMHRSGMADVLVRFANALVGRVKGGLGTAIPLVNMLFGALSGDSIINMAAIGGIMVPRVTQRGYDKRYVTAIAAASSILGINIPPSIGLIIYGFVMKVSVSKLFIATIIPGVIMTSLFIIVHFIYGRRYYPKESPLEMDTVQPGFGGYARDLGTSVFFALPAFAVPVIILGGIYSGLFSPTEASAATATYALLAGLVFYRGLRSFKTVRVTFIESANITGTIMVIVVFAVLFNRILIMHGVSTAIGEGIENLSTNPVVTVLIINVLMLILGMFTEVLVLLIVMAPLIAPVLYNLGFDPIHAAIMLHMNISIGQITPPFALVLFTATHVTGLEYHTFVKMVVPFILFAAIPTLILVACFPELSLWLVGLIRGT